jgi:hypothetical protein
LRFRVIGAYWFRCVLFNFSNFNLPGTNLMTGLLAGGSGSINGTDLAGREAFRAGNGTGTYALGIARQIE